MGPAANTTGRMSAVTDTAMSLTIELTPDLEQVLDRGVASGRFATREEAVAYALRLLEREKGVIETSPETRRNAIERMREIASRNALGPDLTIRQLIDEGRRH